MWIERLFICVLSIYFFHQTRLWCQKRFPDARIALYKWQLQCHIVCTLFGFVFIPQASNLFLQLKVEEPLLQPEDVYGEHYAFYFGYWLVVYYNFLRSDRDSDFKIMISHHFLTLWALITSDYCGFRRIGVYLLLLHDLTDIWIMLMKLSLKLSHRWQMLAYSVCMVFWIYCRLFVFGWYLFCMRVIPRFRLFLQTEDAPFMRKVIYFIPVFCLAGLLLCHVVWTIMLLQIPCQDPREVVDKYEKNTSHKKNLC